MKKIKLVGKGSNTVDFELLNDIANNINLKVDVMNLNGEVVNVVVRVSAEKRYDKYFLADIIQYFYNAYELYHYIITRHLKYVMDKISR